MMIFEALNTIPIGIAVLNSQLVYKFSNKTYLELVNKESHQVLGMSMDCVVPPEIYKTVYPHAKAATRGEAAEFFIKSNHKVPISCYIRYFPMPNERFVALVSRDTSKEEYFADGVQTTITTLNHFIYNEYAKQIKKVSRISNHVDLPEVLRSDINEIKIFLDRIIEVLKQLANYQELSTIEYTNNSNMFDIQSSLDKID